MWNNLVSISDTIMNHIVVRAFEAFSNYPVVGTGFMAALLSVAGLFWFELRKDTEAAKARRARDQDAVVRLRW